MHVIKLLGVTLYLYRDDKGISLLMVFSSIRGSIRVP